MNAREESKDKGECGISYRDDFNDEAGSGAVPKHERELKALDEAKTAQLLTDTVESKGTSVTGRMTTGAARSAETLRLEHEKKTKRDKDLLRSIKALREMLDQIDARITELDKQIDDLKQQLAEAQERSQAAFNRMHALEELLEEIDETNLDDEQRAQLKRALGLDEKDAIDDALLLEMARARIDQEQRIGIEADSEAEAIRDEMEKAIRARDELIEVREEILNDPHASDEEKLARANDALQRSFETDQTGAEVREPDNSEQVNLVTEEKLDDQISELSEAESFELDENMTLDETLSPSGPGLR